MVELGSIGGRGFLHLCSLPSPPKHTPEPFQYFVGKENKEVVTIQKKKKKIGGEGIVDLDCHDSMTE